MAVTAELNAKTLKISCQAGVDNNGDPVYKTYSFKAKADALDQDIYDIATQLNSLQNASLRGIYKEENMSAGGDLVGFASARIVTRDVTELELYA